MKFIQTQLGMERAKISGYLKHKYTPHINCNNPNAIKQRNMRGMKSPTSQMGKKNMKWRGINKITTKPIDTFYEGKQFLHESNEPLHTRIQQLDQT